jgi:acyl carrier protein
MAARGTTVARAAADGLGAISPADGMLLLDVLCRETSPQLAASPIDWTTLAARLRDVAAPALLEDLLAEARVRSSATTVPATAGRAPVDLASLEPASRLERLAGLVRQELATVLGLGGAVDTLDDDSSFTSLGLDSLTAVELRNRLQQVLGRPVPPTAAFEWPSVAALAKGLGRQYEESAAVMAAEDEEGEREELVL